MIEKLYKKSFNNLYQYGCLVHNDKHMVEDIIQNFFIWVLENPEKTKDIKHFEAFAYKSIRRNLIQRIIKENKSHDSYSKFIKDTIHTKTVFSIEKELMSIEENLIQKESLKNALSQLPSKQKEIIYLKYYANFSYDEIVKIMGVSNQVARNYVSRALKKLKKILFSKTINYMVISSMFF